MSPVRTRSRADRVSAAEPDDLAILAAIWVMSCNDENSLISYYGLSHRLGIANADARRLVRSRPELFRPSVPQAWLDDWKQRLGGSGSSPSWYLAIPAEGRAATVAGIRSADVFRNQFRAEHGAAKCSLEVLKWGVEHIELLRKAAFESQRRRRELWTVWIGPAAVFLVALLTMLVPFVDRHWPGPAPAVTRAAATPAEKSSTSRADPSPPLDAYAAFMIALDTMHEAALGWDRDAFQKARAKADVQFYLIEPSFRDDSRGSLTYEYKWIIEMGQRLAIRETPVMTEVTVDRYAEQLDIFKRHVHDTLFGDRVGRSDGRIGK